MQEKAWVSEWLQCYVWHSLYTLSMSRDDDDDDGDAFVVELVFLGRHLVDKTWSTTLNIYSCNC